MTTHTENLRIRSLHKLSPPSDLIEEFPLTNKVGELVMQARSDASKIIHGQDDRLLAIVGPCSIHDPNAALEYASLLKQAIEQYQQDLCIIMRVYFEKPRTTIGWKGLINDPYLDNTFNINHGLRMARKLLLELNTMGVPTGTEFLDTIVPQFISDLIAWGAIGARTTESQIHRELTSGLSMPVGFKNGTDGNVQIAIDAIGSAHSQHNFLGVTPDGDAAIVATTGNDDCHVILRGAKTFTNYDAKHVQEVSEKLLSKQLPHRVMIDCSHGNSRKDHKQQGHVAQDICQQVSSGSQQICGVMLESNLVAGNQSLKDKDKLVYGQSITDACIAWDETDKILDQLAKAVRDRREKGR
jgi:3-deoxy-7-phosphoheptulonate synthase